MKGPERRAPDLPADLVLPPGSLALGPPSWRAGRTSTRPTPVYQELAAVPDDTDAHPRREAPWALLHAGWLLARDPAMIMAGIRRRVAAHLPVLVGGPLLPELLVELGRRGLHAVIEEPTTSGAWADLARRIRDETDDRSLRDEIREESEGLRRHLDSRRSRLRGEAAVLAEELVHTQHALAAVNQELTDHMAQLSLLYRFGRELSAARNWDDTLENLLRSLTEFVGAAGAALILRSAPGGRYAARRTYRWDESRWDKVLLSLHGQVDAEVAESMLAPGVFHVDARGGADDPDRRIVALPLEHQELRLGYLLLLRRPEGESVGQRFLPFLQTVQMVLSEEVAAAQMLDSTLR